MTVKDLTYSDLDINFTEVYELMGYQEANPDSRIVSEMNDMLTEIGTWLHPRFCFFVTRGSLDTDALQLTIGDTTLDVGRIITRQLRGAEAYAFFVCTAGMEYQKYMDRMENSGDMVKAYIAHNIGSALAEATADKMEKMLQSTIDKLHWKRTNRFSPGYCGWHVREQQKLFPLFAGETASVKLTESSLMMPIKSVSGVIGLGPDVRYLPYTCGLCDYADCYKRKKKK